MKNTFGSAVGLTIFGESHGAAVGAVLDGIAAGLAVDPTWLAARMDRRRARGDGLSTARTEPDEVEFLSGVVDGRTTGTPITMVIRNTNTRSGDYAKTENLLRPGHADYTAEIKYEGFQDARGGGHFSGRVTAAAVAAGALCESILAGLGVTVYTHIAVCGGVQDAPLSSSAGLVLAEPAPGHFALLDPGREIAMQEAIRAAGTEGDSVGGVLETIAVGMPAGVGEPFFDSVESELSHLMFAIPAVKGIEFGAGFRLADMRGSEANDPFVMRAGRVETATNRNGGVNGGITNGMPVVFRTVLKPTPSIYRQQDTVDLASCTEHKLCIQGRHDPCIVPRAAVVQNTLTAFGLLDLLCVRYGTLCQKHGLPPETAVSAAKK
jgi:chorismate synthase